MFGKLSRITQAVSLADNQQQVLDLIVSKVCSELGVEVCSIFLADHQLNQFVLKAAQGLNPDSIGHLKIDFNEGLVGLVGQREEPIHLHSADSHPAFHYVEDIREEDLSAYLGVPIIHQRKVLGVIAIQQKEARPFEIDEETFLITLAAQISSVLSDNETDQLIEDELSPPLIRCINGIPASSGVAIGLAKVVFPTIDLSSIPKRIIQDVPKEIKKLHKAVKRTHLQLEKMSNRMKGLISDQELSLFDAYQQILGSAGIEKEVEEQIEAGYWAPYALKTVINKHLKAFRSMEDPYLRERAQDIEDLANRVLANLMRKETLLFEPQENTILVAETISASMLAEIPLENICAVVSLKGSSTSHAGILTKALGLPAIMGLDPCQINRLDGKQMIVDAYNGQIFISPDPELISQYEKLITEEKALSADLEKEHDEPNLTRDGTKIELLVNSSHPIDFEKARQSGAKGIGLYRTEIPFMQQQQFPSEATQVQIYRTIMQGFEGMPVTIRTLDIGGDKQLPYFKIVEDNPFLGWRGVRVTLDHPEIFLVQLRAIFKASINRKNVKIAIPMISTVEELDASLRLINRAFAEIEGEITRPDEKLYRPKIGIILEVPSMLYQLKSVAKRVDFISIGTNDLIQYLLAVDRNNLRLRNLYSHFQPPVLKVMKQLIRECQQAKIELQICGEMASDPLAAIVLIGMGYRELSMTAGNISRVKRAIRHFSIHEMKQLSEQVMRYETAAKVKDALLQAIDKRGLGGLIRAGH
ncbi:MAG: phosphoenolpyruvate--protein phosphotransferase [Enterobacterales bacterium]|nr:phosphoenolpyruvate--protein phosphotransferase [Enterobacterales bacterium]